MKIDRVLSILLRLTIIVVLIAVGFSSVWISEDVALLSSNAVQTTKQLNHTLELLQSMQSEFFGIGYDLKTAVKHADKAMVILAKHSNDILVEVRKSSDALEKVSEKQIEASNREIQVLGSANTLVKHATTDIDYINLSISEVTSESQRTIHKLGGVAEDASLTLGSVDRLVSDPALVDSLKNIDVSAQETAKTISHAEQSMGDVQTMVHRMTSPKSAWKTVSQAVLKLGLQIGLFFK